MVDVAASGSAAQPDNSKTMNSLKEGMVENGGTSGVIAEIAAIQGNDDDANNGE